MAGKEGLAGRLDGVLDRLASTLETQAERLSASPAEHAAESDKVGKGARSLALAARGAAEAGLAVHRLRDAPADEDHDDGEADDEEPRLSAEALEELRDDVERRYSRFDRDEGGQIPADPGFGSGGPTGRPRRLGEPGSRAPAAAAGCVVDLAVPGRAGRGQDPGGGAVAHRPSG